MEPGTIAESGFFAEFDKPLGPVAQGDGVDAFGHEQHILVGPVAETIEDAANLVQILATPPDVIARAQAALGTN